MKRVILFMLIMIGSINICNATDIQDLYGYFSEPCDTEDPTAWNGPKTLEICGDEFDISYKTPDFPCDECCYTIVYYDRWTTYSGSNKYEIYMSAIFLDDYENCVSCLTYDIIAFYRQILLANINISSSAFYSSFIGGSPDRSMYVYNPGTCVENDVQCDDIDRCCKRKMNVFFNDDGAYPSLPTHYIHGSTFPEDATIDPPCIGTCTAKCGKGKQIPDPSLVPILCDLCDDVTPWKPGPPLVVSINDCPGCEITIHYRYRETIDCEPIDYLDYYMDHIELTAACETCYGTYSGGEDLYQFAMNYLMKNGPLGIPEDGECATNYRFVSAACWAVPEGNHFHTCWADDCCWSIWKVCNDEGELDYTRLDGSTQSNPCWNPTEPCIFICELNPINQAPRIKSLENRPVNIGQDASETFAVPNPTTGKVDIHFKSSNNNNIHIELYDMNGNIIFEGDYKKESEELVIPIDVSAQVSGNYFYKIFTDENVINEGAIKLIK